MRCAAGAAAHGGFLADGGVQRRAHHRRLPAGAWRWGLALAALAAALRWVEVLLRPLMLTIKSIPVASFIILALMWLRSAGNLAVFISF